MYLQHSVLDKPKLLWNLVLNELVAEIDGQGGKVVKYEEDLMIIVNA